MSVLLALLRKQRKRTGIGCAELHSPMSRNFLSAFLFACQRTMMLEDHMGRALLLWLIGIPIPIILVVWLLGGLN
jgi:hypothetical protein